MWWRVGGVVAVLSLVVGVYKYQHPSCHRGLEDPHRYLATKRPYDPPLTFSHPPGHESCDPVQVWMVVRHGTRNPSAKVIRKMRNLLPGVRDEIVKAHELGQGALCPEELEALKTWKPPEGLVEAKEKVLVEQGRNELRGIGKRFKERFSNLLAPAYHKDTHKFKYTKTERAEASCKHFVEEIVGKEHSSLVQYPEALSADPVLRFYKGCPKWKKDIDKNPDAYVERKKFETSPYFASVRDSVQTRSGIKEQLPLDVIESMYMTCAFETAWAPDRPSTWCHLFDEQDLEKLQYRQDLEYYWIDGYGFELTYKQACPAIRDMLEHQRSKISGEQSSPSLIAYFTHSGTMLKLISRLGLFNDSQPLLHNNHHLHKYRKWRTSEIDKFATNVATVLYRCPDGHKVGMLFQEKPVDVPGCGSGLCPAEKFFSLYEPFVQDCDITTMCKL